MRNLFTLRQTSPEDKILDKVDHFCSYADNSYFFRIKFLFERVDIEKSVFMSLTHSFLTPVNQRELSKMYEKICHITTNLIWAIRKATIELA